jgi:hypothetical protein
MTTAALDLASRLRRGSVVRGAGVALACLMPGLSNRTRAVVASYGLGWPLDRPGIQLFVVVPDDEAEDWKKIVVPFATSAASWTLAMTVAATVVRRTALPTPVAALLLGGAVAAADSSLAGLGDKLRSKVPTDIPDPAEA